MTAYESTTQSAQATGSVLEQAQTTLQERTEALDASFTTFEGELDGLATIVGDSTDSIQSQTEEVEARSEAMLQESQSQHEQHKGGLDQLSQQIVIFQGDATSEMQAKGGQIEDYQSQSDGVGQSFDERKEAVVADYDTLQADVNAVVEAAAAFRP